MKKLVLVSGNKTSAGNITGYTAKGERVHIPAKQAENAKIDGTQWPLYVFASEREFNSLDEAGNPTNEKFTRLQAGSVFINRQSLISAEVDTLTLDMEVQVAVKESALKAGLSEEAVNALLSVAI